MPRRCSYKKSGARQRSGADSAHDQRCSSPTHWKRMWPKRTASTTSLERARHSVLPPLDTDAKSAAYALTMQRYRFPYEGGWQEGAGCEDTENNRRRDSPLVHVPTWIAACEL